MPMPSADLSVSFVIGTLTHTNVHACLNTHKHILQTHAVHISINRNSSHTHILHTHIHVDTSAYVSHTNMFATGTLAVICAVLPIRTDPGAHMLCHNLRHALCSCCFSFCNLSSSQISIPTRRDHTPHLKGPMKDCC